MDAKIDRIGETGINNFGSEMIIVGYRMNRDIDVYFPKYDWTARSVTYMAFKKGNIKCPYEPKVYEHGYLGEGKFKVHDENGKITKCYDAWRQMLRRCYDSKYHEKYYTYKGCEVHNELLCYQNFGEWFMDNYYEIDGEKMCLDKDILVKGNKIYSPETCVFVPNNINVLFTKRDKSRGSLPIGVSYHKQTGRYRAYCHVYNFKENKSKIKYLGYHNTPEQAFKVYKQFKEKNIKAIADYYKDKIPQKLYDAMYNYEVEITD